MEKYLIEPAQLEFADPLMRARVRIIPSDDERAGNPAISMAWTTSSANSALVAATAWCGNLSQVICEMQFAAPRRGKFFSDRLNRPPATRLLHLVLLRVARRPSSNLSREQPCSAMFA
jgi:hypothetical protein